MPKPQNLLLNGKPLDFSQQHTPRTLKVKAFLDSQWAVYSQKELMIAGGFTKDAVSDFQHAFPSYRLTDGYQGRYPLYGTPEALVAYQEAVRAHADGKR